MSALNHGYWVLGSLLGSFAGTLLPFDTTGVDFAMTALFTVIFTEQWITAPSHKPAIVGLISGIISLVLFGPDNFILPSLVLAVTILCLTRKHTYKKKKEETADELL